MSYSKKSQYTEHFMKTGSHESQKKNDNDFWPKILAYQEQPPDLYLIKSLLNRIRYGAFLDTSVGKHFFATVLPLVWIRLKEDSSELKVRSHELQILTAQTIVMVNVIVDYRHWSTKTYVTT